MTVRGTASGKCFHWTEAVVKWRRFHNLRRVGMDRRQLIVQRVREIFGERLDDVLHMVRQDRQDMRGWQEPAHVRAAVRRRPSARRSAADAPSNRTGGDDRDRGGIRLRGRRTGTGGQQREAVGRMLEAGAAGLEKIVRPRRPN